ncbi:ABC transporter permease [Cohnella endophytica]|uniref:ABC transporter permease n=1 Tax=Cohnella endophytica TaxID=2419778 RepID=A0A494Y319_9BACL|nr:ABC transporter permease [Cohnella endophytica]RKP54296.1 ABC transporter permease [Cohnella endophytica]
MNKFLKIITKESAIVPFIAIVLGLIVGAIIMLIGGYDPILAYRSLLNKVFGNPYDFGETLTAITPLVFTGLSVAFAFRTGLFNIGAEGQYIMGMTGATFVGVNLHMPWYLHAPFAIIVGTLIGGIWGMIAGYLKAARGVNEVITTIMLNWIALHLANYTVNHFLLEPGKGRSYMIDPSAQVTIGWLSRLLDDARVHWGMFFALLCVVFFYVYLFRTKQGYELRVVGSNSDAAQYAGINVNKSIVKAMFISGAFAGMAGVFQVLGVFMNQAIAASPTGHGFDGIAVALLGGNNPVGVLFGAVLFGTLSYGAAGMSFGADVPPEIIRIVIGSVIFFVAAPGIIRWLMKRLSAKKRKGEVV